ncbi:MAG: hypothetical protein KGL39_20035 [Patescibacteria group bacterium]|nr:hypothetical protein [Patescibacteria group bacterium]
MDIINRIVANHVLSSISATAGFAYALGRIDDIIIFALRFFDRATIEAELDRLDSLAKKEVDKVAAQQQK